MSLSVGSLFSGIGGLDLGLERAGMTVVWQSEIDPYASRVLAKHWPNVPNLGDITTIDWSTVEPVDILVGGFPCQDVSDAGQHCGPAGIHGERSGLWASMARGIRHLRPRLILVENVPGLLVRGLGTVLGDLAEIGYDAEWDCLPAAAVGARHLRARVWILAYPSGLGPPTQALQFQQPQRSGWWDTEPGLERVADGIPRRLVEPRDRALGNAVVPQVAEWVGRRIMAVAS